MLVTFILQNTYGHLLGISIPHFPYDTYSLPTLKRMGISCENEVWKMPIKKEHLAQLENVPSKQEAGLSQPAPPLPAQASTSYPQNPSAPNLVLCVNSLSLQYFLIQSINTLLSN